MQAPSSNAELLRIVGLSYSSGKNNHNHNNTYDSHNSGYNKLYNHNNNSARFTEIDWKRAPSSPCTKRCTRNRRGRTPLLHPGHRTAVPQGPEKEGHARAGS